MKLYSFKLGADRVIVREKKTAVVVMQLSLQQIDILERLYRLGVATPRNVVRDQVLIHPEKYTKYKHTHRGWRPLTNAERASYTRSISRLSNLGLITSFKNESRELFDQVTGLGEEVMIQLTDAFTFVRSGIAPLKLHPKSERVS